MGGGGRLLLQYSHTLLSADKRNLHQNPKMADTEPTTVEEVQVRKTVFTEDSILSLMRYVYVSTLKLPFLTPSYYIVHVMMAIVGVSHSLGGVRAKYN